jgi:hypothetical protein
VVERVYGVDGRGGVLQDEGDVAEAGVFKGQDLPGDYIGSGEENSYRSGWSVKIVLSVEF